MQHVEAKRFTCSECGGDVAPRARKNRMYEYRRGVPPLPLPETLVIPECQDCHELFVTDDLVPALEAGMRGPYLRWQASHLGKLVDLLSERHNLSKAQVARLAGVTPSHLSHILAGEKDIASDTLLRLIESFARCSEEVERHKAGTPFDIGAAPRCAWSAPKVAPAPPAPAQAKVFAGFYQRNLDTKLNPDAYKVARLPQPSRAKKKKISDVRRYVS